MEDRDGDVGMSSDTDSELVFAVDDPYMMSDVDDFEDGSSCNVSTRPLTCPVTLPADGILVSSDEEPVEEELPVRFRGSKSMAWLTESVKREHRKCRRFPSISWKYFDVYNSWRHMRAIIFKELPNSSAFKIGINTGRCWRQYGGWGHTMVGHHDAYHVMFVLTCVNSVYAASGERWLISKLGKHPKNRNRSGGGGNAPRNNLVATYLYCVFLYTTVSTLSLVKCEAREDHVAVRNVTRTVLAV